MFSESSVFRNRKQRVKECTDGKLYIRQDQDRADVVTGFSEEKRAYIMFNRNFSSITTRRGRVLETGQPKSWMRKDFPTPQHKNDPNVIAKTNGLLEACQEHFADYESTIVEFSSKCGIKIMWSTVPAVIKEQFKCTDVKTLEGWGSHKLDFGQFKPGMKVRVRIDSVNCYGRYTAKPLLRGTLLSVEGVPVEELAVE